MEHPIDTVLDIETGKKRGVNFLKISLNKVGWNFQDILVRYQRIAHKNFGRIRADPATGPIFRAHFRPI